MKKSLQIFVFLGAMLIPQSNTLGMGKEIIENGISEATECAKIFAGSVVASAAYAILNDQVTARICLPYFTEGFHKANLRSWSRHSVLKNLKSVIENNSTSPTIVGATWGAVAGGQMGVFLGVPLVLASRIGSPAATHLLGAITTYQAFQCARGKSNLLGLALGAGLTAASHTVEWPQMKFEEMVKPTAIAIGATGAGALAGGIVAYLIGKTKTSGGLRNNSNGGVQSKDLHSFFTCSGAHQGAYAAGALSGLSLIGYVLRQRCVG